MEKKELPVEVVQQIEKEAEAHNERLKEHAENERDVAYAQGFAEGWHEGATVYATKTQELKEETLKTYRDWHALYKENTKLKEQATGWRPLLEEVLRENRLYGHVPNETINKISKFLYGE